MWLYLEIGPLKRQLRLNEVIWVCPNTIWLVFLYKEEIWRLTYRENTMWNENSHLQAKDRGPWKKPTLSWTSSLQSHEEINLFKPPSLWILYYDFARYSPHWKSPPSFHPHLSILSFKMELKQPLGEVIPDTPVLSHFLFWSSLYHRFLAIPNTWSRCKDFMS